MPYRRKSPLMTGLLAAGVSIGVCWLIAVGLTWNEGDYTQQDTETTQLVLPSRPLRSIVKKNTSPAKDKKSVRFSDEENRREPSSASTNTPATAPPSSNVGRLRRGAYPRAAQNDDDGRNPNTGSYRGPEQCPDTWLSEAGADTEGPLEPERIRSDL